jgi:hypothetical protein
LSQDKIVHAHALRLFARDRRQMNYDALAPGHGVPLFLETLGKGCKVPGALLDFAFDDAC